MNQPKEQVEVPEAAMAIAKVLERGFELYDREGVRLRFDADALLPTVAATAALPAIEQAVEVRVRERLLSDENIERAALKSYEDFRDLELMPDDARWPDLEEDIKAELRTGLRENTQYAFAALSQPHNTEEEK